MNSNVEYAININFFTRNCNLRRACEFATKAGFTQLDYTPRLMDDNWKIQLKDAIKIFEDNGLSVNQTHMPFNRYGRYGDMHKICMDRCAEATEMTDAKFIVAHGDEFDFTNLEFSSEAALDYNHNYFLPYVERAQKNGYKIAFETVFEDGNIRRYSSREDELKALITSFNSDSVVCCWDFGHSHVSFGKRAPDIIRDFGSMIQCTHLHDNTGIDAHTIPLLGDINWAETISAFKDIGYNGILSVEYSHGNIPEYLVADFLNLTYKSAKHLWSI